MPFTFGVAVCCFAKPQIEIEGQFSNHGESSLGAVEEAECWYTGIYSLGFCDSVSWVTYYTLTTLCKPNQSSEMAPRRPLQSMAAGTGSHAP